MLSLDTVVYDANNNTGTVSKSSGTKISSLMRASNIIHVYDSHINGCMLEGKNANGDDISFTSTFSFIATKLCCYRANGLINNSGNLIEILQAINTRYPDISDSTRFVFCDINSVLVILSSIYNGTIQLLPQKARDTIKQIIYNRCLENSMVSQYTYQRMTIEEIKAYEQALLEIDSAGLLPDNNYRGHGRLEMVINKLFTEKYMLDYYPLCPVIVIEDNQFAYQDIVIMKCRNNVCNECEYCLSNGDDNQLNVENIYKKVSINNIIYEFVGGIMKHYNKLPLLHCYVLAVVPNSNSEEFLLIDETGGVRISLTKPFYAYKRFNWKTVTDPEVITMDGSKCIGLLLGQVAYAFYKKV